MTRHLLTTLLILLSAHAGAQVKITVEQRVQAGRDEALRIWSVQREKGNNAAITESNECRARLLKTKTKYDADVEACLIVDYYVSMTTASFYERLSAEYRRVNNIDVEKIRNDVGRRISSAYSFFKLTPEEARDASRVLRESISAVEEAAASKK